MGVLAQWAIRRYADEVTTKGARSLPKAVPVRVALYVLLVLSAGAALFVQPALSGAVTRGALSPEWLFIPLGVYGLFLVAYAVDRALLIKKRRYPAGKALFQVAFGVLFALTLLPWKSLGPDTDYRRVGVALPDALLDHPDADIRATAVLAVGYRGPSPRRADRLLTLLSQDEAPQVRDTAAEVLARWSGRPRNDGAGIKEWASALSSTSTRSEGE